jgi:hypothetical protein
MVEEAAVLSWKDLNGQALAYMYFEKESRRRHRRGELLTRDEARRNRGANGLHELV